MREQDYLKKLKKLEDRLPLKVTGATGRISTEFMKENHKKRKKILDKIKELKATHKTKKSGGEE